MEQGIVVHYCDTPMAYGMLVKAGLGIGLLGYYTALERDAVPLDLDIRMSVPLYALALTERLSHDRSGSSSPGSARCSDRPNPWFGRNFA